jgi:uncharacterized membrane protein YkvA (DUF1232 family)
VAEDVKYGEVLGPEDDLVREARVRRGFWNTMRRAARRIPFAEDVVAGYYAAIDRSTPVRVRAILLGALAYFILPADTIPDFVVGLGFTDDAAVLLAALTAVRTHIRPAHRAAAKSALADGEGP